MDKGTKYLKGKEYIIYYDDKLGGGSFGNVYRGKVKKTKEMLAIKKISKNNRIYGII